MSDDTARLAAPTSYAATTVRDSLITRRFFVDRRSKVEIADEFGISRFAVARVIGSAIDQGRVRIEIDGPKGFDASLSLELKDAYGLRLAAVAALDGVPADAQRGALGTIAADLISDLIGPTDVLGWGWGRTLEAVAEALPPLPAVDVVALMGGSSSPGIDNAAEVASKVADRTSGGRLHPMHAPFLVRDEAIADALREEPVVADTMAMYSRVTKAVLGIGSWVPPSSGYRRALDEPLRLEFDALGVAADVCALLVADDGSVLSGGLEGRTMAMPERLLRAVPEVVAVAGGSEKVRAVQAVVRTGLVTTLVIDSVIARALLG